jgi:hypothetical protein
VIFSFSACGSWDSEDTSAVSMQNRFGVSIVSNPERPRLDQLLSIHIISDRQHVAARRCRAIIATSVAQARPFDACKRAPLHKG